MGLITMTFLVFLLSISGLALGVIARRPALLGTCGGISGRQKIQCMVGCQKPCANNNPEIKPGTCSAKK